MTAARPLVPTLLLALLCSLVLTAPAFAEGNCSDSSDIYGGDEESGSFDCKKEDAGSEGGGTGGVFVPKEGAIYEAVLSGAGCWHVIEGGDQVWADASAAMVANATEENPVCDYSGGDLGTLFEGTCRPEPPTPVQLDPSNTAIVGLTGYLDIGTPEYIDLPCGPSTVRAYPRTYHIDWGDGTTTETTSRGGPYPDGDITHTYEDTSATEIRVSATWEGFELVGDEEILIGEVDSDDAVIEIEIQERQAVGND